jgi:hypothetical protein
MPMTTAQLLAGANTQLASYAKNDPVDQFSTKRPFMKWLMDNAEQSIFGNGVFNEKVLIGDSSNYQNYTGDDQVTYNRKDNYRLAPFQDYEAHDGFALNETELAHNGVNITEDKEAVMTEAEKIQIVNIIKWQPRDAQDWLPAQSGLGSSPRRHAELQSRSRSRSAGVHHADR